MDAVVDAVPVLGGVVEGVGVLDVPDEMVADGDDEIEELELGELDTDDDSDAVGVADTAVMAYVNCMCGVLLPVSSPFRTYRYRVAVVIVTVTLATYALEPHVPAPPAATHAKDVALVGQPVPSARSVAVEPAITQLDTVTTAPGYSVMPGSSWPHA